MIQSFNKTMGGLFHKGEMMTRNRIGAKFESFFFFYKNSPPLGQPRFDERKL